MMNLILAALTLAPAAALKFALAGHDGALPLSLFFTCAGVTLLTWLALLWGLKHPLYLEALPLLKARMKR
jgi:hypothetical protein